MGRLNTYLFIAALALIFMNTAAYSQKGNFDIIPDEEIFVHTNAKIFVAGESLYYQMHCFNTETNKPSAISKVAYVLLVDETKEIVFEHKLVLEKGLANNVFYIPSSVRTGHYKLVSFTKWMNNNEENPYFSTDIYIINPFSTRSNGTLTANKEQKIDSILLKESEKSIQNLNEGLIELHTDERTYNTRSKVSLELKTISDLGSYSISVRKTEPIELLTSVSTKASSRDSRKNDVFQLPELRGEIISGTVFSIADNMPVSNKIVGLSILGNNGIFKNVRTNESGKFYFSLHENYRSGQILTQVLDQQYQNYKLVLDEFTFKYFDELEFNQLDLHPNIKSWLLQKSFNSQIESAYFDVKKDSILDVVRADDFLGETGKTFVLDDYTRFSTVKETLIEVVQGAGVRSVDGEKKIIVFSPESIQTDQQNTIDDLVLIDGIPIQDHEIFLGLNPKLIESITVVNNVYFYGPSIFNGMLSVKTMKGDFSLPYDKSRTVQEINNPEEKRVYFSYDYDDRLKEYERIPDNRTQLLWLPQVKPNKNSISTSFFTSDVLGTYEILVEAYTNNRKHIKLSKFIEVK